MGDDGGLPTRQQSNSLTYLIAWLSVCLLAAAWGSSLDPAWRPIWKNVGLFGLVSAVGLSVAAKYRAVWQQRAERRAIEEFLEQRLTHMVMKNEANDAVRQIVGQLAKEIACASLGPRDRRTEADAPFSHPVEITPLDRHASEQDDAPLLRTTAYIRNLSTTGVGLLHRAVLRPGPMLLCCQLQSGDTLRAIVDIRWCKDIEDGWHTSGGKFVDAAPADVVTAIEGLAADDALELQAAGLG